MVNLTVSGSTTSTASIGPQLVLVRLGLSPNARSTVNLTSLASNGVPSWQTTPSCSSNTYSSPSSLTVHALAKCGCALPSSSNASMVS